MYMIRVKIVRSVSAARTTLETCSQEEDFQMVFSKAFLASTEEILQGLLLIMCNNVERKDEKIKQ